MSKRTNKKIIFWVLALLAITDLIVWYQIGQVHNLAGENSKVYFLDVGQGDSQLIIFPGGPKLLIDAGNPDGKVLTALAKVLPPQDRYIDMLLMTHPQLDHFGGFIDVLKNYEVGAFIGSGRKGTAGAYKTLMDEIEQRHISYIELKEGDRILYHGAEMDVLSPNSKDLLSGELNDTCLVTLLKDKNFRALFMCDAGMNIEDELIKKYDLSADILKVGHHGSKTSTSEALLGFASPAFAVISAGRDNTYGHAHQEVLDRLSDFEVETLGTYEHGTIVMESDGETVRIKK